LLITSVNKKTTTTKKKTISVAATRLLTQYIRNDQKPTQQYNSMKQTYLYGNAFSAFIPFPCMKDFGIQTVIIDHRLIRIFCGLSTGHFANANIS